MMENRPIQLLLALAIVVMALLSARTISALQVPVSSDDTRLAALEWYFAHDHAVLDGDNNVLSIVTNRGESQWAPLDWYLAHDHAILDGDNNVLSK